jgi:two-component system, LytTR family, response regulator
MRMRAIIVDDEPPARRRLIRLLRDTNHVDVVSDCPDGASAIAAIQKHNPDLAFLDVQMPRMTGFELLAALPQGRLPVVIFVTAFDQYALDAFEAQALDYLLKPFDGERVMQAVERARKFLGGSSRITFEERITNLLQSASELRPPCCVLVKASERTLLLRPPEIDWIEADGDYVRFHVGQVTYLERGTLAAMEQRLKGNGFVRIYRSLLVNIDRIREFQPAFRGECFVVLKGGTRLKASPQYLKALREQWAKLR